MSGTHTGVGLDSFIGRAAHRGERGREEGSGIGERGEGTRGRERGRAMKTTRGPVRGAIRGTNGKNETLLLARRELVKNQFAAHYAIRGTRVCLPR